MTKRRRNGIDCDAIGIYWSFIATCAVHYIDGAVLVTKQRIDKRSDREGLLSNLKSMATAIARFRMAEES